MNLEQTPESIVPEQSVIDSWPTKVRTTSNACQKQEPVEVIFDAERWLYERKSAYPMVECLPGPADGMWKTFRYHPVCNGVVLKDQDVLVLYPNGNYYVKPDTNQEGCEHHPSKCCECMLKEIDEEYLNWISDEEKHLKAALISINEVP